MSRNRVASPISMTLLREFRAPEAVAVLTKHIDYRDPRTLVTDHISPYSESFPSANALVKIGLPSVGALLTKIQARDATDQARKLALWGVHSILGRTLAVARLKQEIDQAGSQEPQQKKRLQEALATMLSDPREWPPDKGRSSYEK